MSKAFSDLGKDCDDLINGGFPAQGSAKLVIEAPTTSTASSIKVTIKRDNKDVVEATVEPKHEWKAKNIEFTGRAVTTKEYEAGLSVKDIGYPGTKVSITNLFSRGVGVLKGSTAFKNKTFNTKLGIAYPLDKPPKAAGEVVFNYPSPIHFGVYGEYDTAKHLFNWSAAITYVTAVYQGHLFFKNRRHSSNEEDILFGVGWLQELSSNWKFAVNFVVSNNREAAEPTCVIASEGKIDVDTTLKGKIAVKAAKKTTDCRVGLALKQKINSHLTVTIGSDLNARALLNQGLEGEGHSLGFEIKLS